MSLTQEQRQEIHRQYFYKLCDIRSRLDRLENVLLGDDLLKRLGIRKLALLDVDNDGHSDTEQYFFAPFAKLDKPEDIIHPDEQEVVLDEWYRHSSCRAAEMMCIPISDAEFLALWFKESLCGCRIPHDWLWTLYLCKQDALPHWTGDNRLEADKCPEFRFHAAFTLHENPDGDPFKYRKPHIAGLVADSTEATESEVLRSEIDCAITLLKHQVRHLRYTNHHTIPALLYSIQHNKYARITQAYIDGSKQLVLRQSRLLDIHSRVPTADVYLLLRWMANKPIGKTAYGLDITNKSGGNVQKVHGGKA